MWRLRTHLGFIISISLIGIALASVWYFIIKPAETTASAPQAQTKRVINKPSQKPKAANETDRIILSLFDSSLDNTGLAFEQNLRSRYRNAYIGIYLLKSCDVDVRAYHQALADAFTKEWDKKRIASPPAQDVNTMLTAIIEEARSSYTMLYINTPCEKRNLGAFKEFFEAL